MHYAMEKLVQSMYSSVDVLLAQRGPLPTPRAQSLAKIMARKAVLTWARKDGSPTPARCPRCKKRLLMITDIDKIAETGTCKFCSLPEVES